MCIPVTKAWGLLAATKYAHVIFKRCCSSFSSFCCRRVLASANSSCCCSRSSCSCCCFFCSSCCSFFYCCCACSCLFHSCSCSSSPFLPRPCPLVWLFICTFSYALKYNRRRLRRRPCNSFASPLRMGMKCAFKWKISQIIIINTFSAPRPRLTPLFPTLSFVLRRVFSYLFSAFCLFWAASKMRGKKETSLVVLKKMENLN